MDGRRNRALLSFLALTVRHLLCGDDFVAVRLCRLKSHRFLEFFLRDRKYLESLVWKEIVQKINQFFMELLNSKKKKKQSQFIKKGLIFSSYGHPFLDSFLLFVLARLLQPLDEILVRTIHGDESLEHHFLKH